MKMLLNVLSIVLISFPASIVGYVVGAAVSGYWAGRMTHSERLAEGWRRFCGPTEGGKPSPGAAARPPSEP